ncbi:MAG: copper resistance CopC family protein [Methylocystis sp.]
MVLSSPRADDSIQGDELSIEIRFNSRIDAARSNLKLFKIDGGAVALPILDAGSPDRLKAKATGLKPGAYRLHWQTLSPDGHITQGDIPFAVSR